MKSRTEIELSLFEVQTLDPPPPPLKERLRSIEWSFSRRNTAEQCPQKYYLDYYGSSKRHAATQANKDILRQLGNLKNRYERTGEIVHAAIANYFRLAQKGIHQSTNSLLRGAKSALADNIATSQKLQSETAAGSVPLGALVEFLNEPDKAAQLYEDAGARMCAALTNFATHDTYAKVRAAGASAGAAIERMFKLSSPCRVAGVVDLAVSPDMKPAILDWKSGKETVSEDDSLQLTAYTLWGSQHFSRPPEAISIYKAFLGAGTLVRFPLTAASVAKGKRRILQDLERMVEMHPYGVDGRRNAFTPCAQRRVCVLCPYLQQCPEGKETVYD